MMSSKILIILQGLPGSGKSTLARKLIEEGKASEHCEADHYMTERGKYVFKPSKLGFAHNACRTHVEHAMQQGLNVIQSNTNVKRGELNAYFDLAEHYGYKVKVIKMKNQFVSIHDVPQSSMDRMKDSLGRFDWSELPEYVTVTDQE